jgi:multidrug efflux pump subunit AcrB
VVRLSDVARVEMGSEDYTATANLNGHPAAGIAVMMAPGANALDTATLVKSKIAEFSVRCRRATISPIRKTAPSSSKSRLRM